jgi:hypothetical protein
MRPCSSWVQHRYCFQLCTLWVMSNGSHQGGDLVLTILLHLGREKLRCSYVVSERVTGVQWTSKKTCLNRH